VGNINKEGTCHSARRNTRLLNELWRETRSHSELEADCGCVRVGSLDRKRKGSLAKINTAKYGTSSAVTKLISLYLCYNNSSRCYTELRTQQQC
jgi:hypothetical protein